MGLVKTYYPVSEESIGGVEICVTVDNSSVNFTCPIDLSFAVTLTAVNGTAGMYVVNGAMYINEALYDSFSVAHIDYVQNTPVTLEFEKCNMTRCHCIPIVNDDVPESNEMFYVTLEGTADLDRDTIRLDPVNGTIIIIDASKHTNSCIILKEITLRLLVYTYWRCICASLWNVVPHKANKYFHSVCDTV